MGSSVLTNPMDKHKAMHKRITGKRILWYSIVNGIVLKTRTTLLLYIQQTSLIIHACSSSCGIKSCHQLLPSIYSVEVPCSRTNDDPVSLQKLKNVACCVIEYKSNRTISPARDEDTYLVFTRAQASDGSCRRVDTAAASRRSMSFYIDYAHNHHHRSSSIPYSNGDGVPVDAEDPLH